MYAEYQKGKLKEEMESAKRTALKNPDNAYLQHLANSAAEEYEDYEIPTVKNDLQVYRKGGLDDTVLSFTTSKRGAKVNGKILPPDRTTTVRQLMAQGVYPVSGVGAKHNLYGEDEVTIVNLNAVNGKHASVSTTKLAGGSAYEIDDDITQRKKINFAKRTTTT
jgi:hypothetical protein